jgi:hypothetical protein
LLAASGHVGVVGGHGRNNRWCPRRLDREGGEGGRGAGRREFN